MQMKNQNITKKLFYSFATASLLCLAACSSDDEPTVKETSKIEIKDFAVKVAAGDTTLNFTASGNWRAALSSTSWIQIDPMTKAGSKGDAKIILNWNAHTGITPRSAELSISVENEAPVVILITQLPNEPIVVVNKTESLLNINPKADDGRGAFCDTLTIQSNVKWSVKEQPKWVDYEVIGTTEPQEGVPTTIQLVVKGKPAAFNAPVMKGNFILGKSGEASLDHTVELQTVSELNVFSAENEEQPLSKVILRSSPEAGGRFVGRMVVKANTAWSILDMPEWAATISTDNSAEYANKLITRKTVSFELKEDFLDTEGFNQTIRIRDEKTGLQSDVELVFEGTGNDYFESKLAFPPDFIFDASVYTPSFDYVEGAILDMDFDMVSARDYNTLEEAPFEFFFLHTNEIVIFQQQVYWAGVEMAPAQTRAALNTKKLTLYVNDRQMDFSDENKNVQRSAYMVVAPKGTLFDDLFDPATGELKNEFFLSSRLVRQKPVAKELPEADIPSEVNFAKEGGKQTFGVKNFDMIAFKIDGNDAGALGNWISFEFDDMSNITEVSVIAQPNTSGKKRSSLIEIMYFDLATSEESVIYSFKVNQE